MSVIAIDFETFYSKKLKYGLKQQIAESYCRSEHFDCYLLSVTDGTDVWAGHPRDFTWSSLDGHTIISHNKYFDYNVWLELARRGLCPQPNFKEYHCTANLTSYLCNRRALAQAVEYLFGTKVAKDYRDIADGKQWPNDYTEEQRKYVTEAGRIDVQWCWRIWDKYSAQWPEFERRISNQTIAQGMRGVQINRTLLDEYIIRSHEMKLRTESIIPWIAEADDESWEEFNTKPTSSKCIAEQCQRIGIPCPPVKSDDEEAYEEWEDEYAPKYPWIVALSAWRSINKLYKTFMVIKERLRSDGTLPFALKYFGAHTGRWAGADKVNMQNPRKKPIICNEHGLMEVKRVDDALRFRKKNNRWPDWVKYDLDFRALICPRPGRKMIISDLSQIEPRVLAWLSGNTDLLAKIRGGMSVYESFARTSFGYTDPVLDTDSDYYKMTKIQVLGLGYQAGWLKFITMAADGGFDITADDPEFVEKVNPLTGKTEKVSGFGETSRGIVKSFRDANPKMVALWNQLDTAFKRSVGSEFVIHLPSGRKLTYPDVRCKLKVEVDKATGKPVKKWVFTADTGGKFKIYYGGKLAENVTQAAARDVFAFHLLRVEDAGNDVLFSSHDEAVLETDPSVTARDIEQIMSEAPDWMPGLPVAAKAQEVEHYTK